MGLSVGMAGVRRWPAGGVAPVEGPRRPPPRFLFPGALGRGCPAVARLNSAPPGGRDGRAGGSPNRLGAPRPRRAAAGGDWRSAGSGKSLQDLAGEFAGRRGRAKPRSPSVPHPAPRAPRPPTPRARFTRRPPGSPRAR